MTPYCLKSDYVSRDVPDYFVDGLADSESWQADVYRLGMNMATGYADAQAQPFKPLPIVDLGCGNGKKLSAWSETGRVIGVDHGSNAQAFKANVHGRFNDVDLNAEVIHPTFFRDTVVICADVIEHLPDPDPLLHTLYNACQTAACVLVSTPDRHRIHPPGHNGPPTNKHHVREWSNHEFFNLLHEYKLPVQWFGWTVSHKKYNDQRWTSLAILSLKNPVLALPPNFEPAPLTWDMIGRRYA